MSLFEKVTPAYLCENALEIIIYKDSQLDCFVKQAGLALGTTLELGKMQPVVKQRFSDLIGFFVG